MDGNLLDKHFKDGHLINKLLKSYITYTNIANTDISYTSPYVQFLMFPISIVCPRSLVRYKSLNIITFQHYVSYLKFYEHDPIVYCWDILLTNIA